MKPVTFLRNLCLFGLLACSAALGRSTGAEPPAAEANPPAFQRLQMADAQTLTAQLQQVHELDLKDAPFTITVADYVGELRAHQAFLRAGGGRSARAEEGVPVPKQLVELHREACQAHGLPSRPADVQQLAKTEAVGLAVWARTLRAHQLVSVPSRAGQWEAPKLTSFPDFDTKVLAQSTLQLKDGVPALEQMLQAEAEPSRQLLVVLLGLLDTPAAAQALARRALYDVSPQVREAAVAALRRRPLAQYRAVLLDGFRYPWPAVAEHAAEALVALADREALPALEKLLTEPDPRLPVVQQGTTRAPQVAELVRINHLRNCLLCHPLATGGANQVAGAVPTPGKRLEPVYYSGEETGGIQVRADITHLRQDFSLVQRVEQQQPWPSEQRFDFLVRRRAATPGELANLEKPPATYPQRDAVLFALKALQPRQGR